MNRSIEDYLEGSTKTVPFKYRRAVRHLQEVSPWSAGISEELTMHLLTTKFGNTVCPQHGERDKSGTLCDPNVTEESPYQVTGTPYERVVFNGKKGIPSVTKGE